MRGEKTRCRNREKTTTYKPRREALGETSPANTFIFDSSF